MPKKGRKGKEENEEKENITYWSSCYGSNALDSGVWTPYCCIYSGPISVCVRIQNTQMSSEKETVYVNQYGSKTERSPEEF